jgi:hypothetical protein
MKIKKVFTLSSRVTYKWLFTPFFIKLEKCIFFIYEIYEPDLDYKVGINVDFNQNMFANPQSYMIIYIHIDNI